MRPFGCLVTIFNTLDPLGKFDGKANEGFLVGYSVNSKAFRVFNSRTQIVQETLHINFLENKPNVVGIGPKWLFDIDTLTKCMNYQLVVVRNLLNDNAGIKENLDARKHDDKANRDAKGKSHVDLPTRVRDLRAKFEEFSFNSTNRVISAAKLPILNPNEFDLWKIRIEQYFLMTDYSLWDVILNSDSPILTRVVDDKHQLKFNIHKDAKSLMESIEKRFGGNKETKKVQKTLLKVENSHFNLEEQDRSGRPNTNESVSAVTSVSAASTKFLVSTLPNVDNLSNVVIYSFFASQSNNPQLDNDDLKQIDVDDLEEIDLKWKGHFAREYRSPKDTRNKDTQRRNVLVETSTSNPIAPTTAEQRLARKNELKARGLSSESLDQIHDRLQKLISQLEILRESLSQEDINLKFLRSLPNEWMTLTLIWRNKTDLEEQSLDDLFNSLKIYEVEVKSSSSASNSTQKIVFVSSQTTDNTNEPVSVIASVSAASAKIPIFALPNIDTLSNARTGRNLGANGPTSIRFDMSKGECYNRYRKGHFASECRSPKDTRRNVVAKPQRRNVPVETSTSNALVSQCDESVEARLLVYQQNEFVFEEDIKLIKLEVRLRDNALVVLRQKFEKVEQERDDLKLKLKKFQTSSKNLSQLLASQTNDKTGLGYNTQVFTSSMFDCDEMFISKTDDSLPTSPNYYSFVQPTKQVKTPMPFVKPVENLFKLPIIRPPFQGLKAMEPAVIERHSLCEPSPKGKSLAICKNDTSKSPKACGSYIKSKLIPITAARPVTAAVPKPHVTRPR
nr:retrovirus-related Pol polyprotein from transposon TNT 1-94 [Tanacetum cinerariifolium]